MRAKVVACCCCGVGFMCVGGTSCMCESMCCVHCGVVFVCVVCECGGWRSARRFAVWSIVVS